MSDRSKDRKMELVDVEMEQVELVRPLAHLVEHQQIIGDHIAHRGGEPKRRTRAGCEFRRGQRVAAGKQSHIMALPDEFFGQIRNDPLGASIIGRWHAFDWGSDLRDPHR
jgi:hypothetical protein